MKQPVNKAVIYCRVSSPEQVKNGHGLTSQETRCREFAKYRGLQVVEAFHEEGVSGGLIDRPAITRMLDFLRRQKREQYVVIIDDISRLARDLKAHIELRMAISTAGGILQSPSIEFGDDSDSRLVENLLASVSQHHRQKNAEQVKNRMRSRMLGGYWIMKTPVGYKMEKVPGHGKMMIVDEPVAAVIKEGLEGYANSRFTSVTELKMFFEQQPNFPKNKKGTVDYQRALDVMNRMLYTGYFEFKQWDIPLMRGKHEPIISFETYTKIQDKMRGKTHVPARKDINEDFILRGFVLCDCCKATLTACWAAGRVEKYPYYLCRNKNCKLYGKSIKREQVHNDFETLLREITPSPAMVGLMKDLIEEAKERRFESHEEIIDSYKKEKRLVESKIEQFLDRIITTQSPTLLTTYERQIDNLEGQRIVLEEKISNLANVDDCLETVNRTALDFIQNPYARWALEDLSGKRLVLKATFSRPLVYSKDEGYRTAALSLPFMVLRGLSDVNSDLVDPRGVEPLTA